ncbi:MAG TPA: hypothetical protein EYH45_02360 [Candidatus Caldiarchaeum subterraneum]|uniref:Uncharacterized protein n=1 Tax=Caldiarchaeum subterraneum TaxID=311458 RepID=A0A833A3C3_CALS0|nr:hypothetical protein [Candidatus Caldarchaeum subterraneum]
MKIYRLWGYSIALAVFKVPDGERMQNLVDRLDEINSEIKPAEAQLFNADNILDEEHVKVALVNAVMSFNSPNRAARSLRMEFLLKLAATDQVREAISKLGVGRGTERAAILAIASDEDGAVRVLGEIRRMLGAVEELELPRLVDSRVEVLKKLYNVSQGEIESTQAGSYAEAFKLTLAHRIATSRL